MIEYKTVSTRSPPMQILLTSDVCRARVQDTTLTSLNSYEQIGKEKGRGIETEEASVNIKQLLTKEKGIFDILKTSKCVIAES